MNKEFMISIKVKTFIESLDKNLINYPRKGKFVINYIYDDAFNLLKLIYKNNLEDNKNKYKNDIITLISMLDYYLEYSYKMKYICHKVCEMLSRNLQEITKMIYNWLKNGS